MNFVDNYSICVTDWQVIVNKIEKITDPLVIVHGVEILEALKLCCKRIWFFLNIWDKSSVECGMAMADTFCLKNFDLKQF